MSAHRLLYLVSLRSYTAEIDSFFLSIAHVVGERDPWFDIAILCEEEMPRRCSDFGRYRVYGIRTAKGGGLYDKLPSAVHLVAEYSHICLCTADDVWSIPFEAWSMCDNWWDGSKVLAFNHLCAQPIESRRLLAWRGFKQLNYASKIKDRRDRLKQCASQGPLTVHAVYESKYFLDLILSVSNALNRLRSENPKYEQLVEDLINVSNLMVGLTYRDNVWVLRYFNSNYGSRRDFMMSEAVIKALNPALFRSICSDFVHGVMCHSSDCDERISDQFYSYVESHAIGYSAANSRFWREGFDIVLCTSENVVPHNGTAGRKFWPVRVLRAGSVGYDNIPMSSELRCQEAIDLLNHPSQYWLSLNFTEWNS